MLGQFPGNNTWIFSISEYCYSEIDKFPAKTKIFSKIFKGVNLGSRYYGFMKKTRLQKSHATVPLKGLSHKH